MHISRTRKKSYKNRFISSIITLLLTVSCFVFTSYAWFTNSAYVSGNKVFAGNLMVDVLISEDDLKKNLGVADGDDFSDAQKAALAPFKYTRNLSDDSTETYYYASRIPATVNELAIDTSILHVENVEPGQAIRVKVNIVNSGDLALKAAGALRVDESFTGLETLINKNKLDGINFDEKGIPNSFTGDYTDTSNKSGYASIDQNTFFFNTLLNIQAGETDGEETPDVEIGVKKFKDNGGHLEDVLCVYLLEGVGDGEIDIDREALDKELEDLKQDERFFGTLKQFQYMLEHGANPTPDNIEEYYNLWNDNPYEISMARVLGDLESDYQRYLAYASGYCLPVDTIKDSENDNKIAKNGIDVEIKDMDDNLLYVKEGVSEIDTINFLLYMPLEAGDEYQNASISLSLGATATQVEFEADDTGYVIYDQSKVKNYSHEYTVIKYTDSNWEEQTIKIPLITYSGEITFDAGEHGSYVTPPPAINQSDLTNLDLTNSQYTPIADHLYKFAGFKFKNNKLIACYESTLPKKGDVIILTDTSSYQCDEPFKVLKMDDTNAFVVSLQNSDALYFSNEKYTEDSGGITYIKYSGSNLDDYLYGNHEGTWLYSIEQNFPNIFSAIVPQTINRNVYKLNENFPSDDAEYVVKGTYGENDEYSYYITCEHEPVETYDKHVFALDLADILEYLGYDQNTKKTLTKNDLISMFEQDLDIWLRSVCVEDGKTWCVSAYPNYNLNCVDYNTENVVARPAFVINLAYEGIEFAIQ